MTSEVIEKYIESENISGKLVTVSFKQRNNITGLFIQGYDYAEMKKKNFWRIVAESKMTEWRSSNDINLSRIFSGSDFTKIK
jgi:predicted small secreted protein